MSTFCPKRKLRDVAEIRVSNVDKKICSSETLVKLCNYMDVYSNDYISGGIDFMEGSATTAEIERFGLNAGDVIITKDSETPDDIGIPTVIIENISGLVCGYHLALIRPDAEQLDSVYLAKQLSTSQITRYFSLRASGSTRYGLPISAIESLEIPTPPKPEQSKIAEILSTVDRAIEQTERLIAKQQRIKTGLMQDLLTRGIDEHGNLRCEETHKDMVPICEIAEINPQRPPISIDKNTEVSFIPMADVTESARWKNRQTRLYKDVNRGYTYFSAGDVLFAKITPCSENGKGCHAIDVKNGIGFASTEFHVLRAKRNSDPAFIYQWSIFQLLRIKAAASMTGSAGQQRVPSSFFDTYKIPKFKKNEQTMIAEILTTADYKIEQSENQRDKLRSLKTALMQDLLTGKVRVTPLMKNMEGGK